MKNSAFAGRWRIFEMSEWDREYFDMEVKAFISIAPGNTGNFQFGLVSGDIDGEIVHRPDGRSFEFTWEGNDECEPASGSGCLRLEGKNMIRGEIKFHRGDRSGFKARRTK